MCEQFCTETETLRILKASPHALDFFQDGWPDKSSNLALSLVDAKGRKSNKSNQLCENEFSLYSQS